LIASRQSGFARHLLSFTFGVIGLRRHGWSFAFGVIGGWPVMGCHLRFARHWGFAMGQANDTQ